MSSTTVGASVPDSHLDLFQRAVCGVLTTIGPDGMAQSSLVWVDYDGECACVNTTVERRKGRNMATNPHVSLLVVDPDDTGRFVAIRGDAELLRAGAIEHLDRLTATYTGKPHFYGFVHPARRRGEETRIICRIHARRVTTDAIYH